jgi:hypothetical protein
VESVHIGLGISHSARDHKLSIIGTDLEVGLVASATPHPVTASASRAWAGTRLQAIAIAVSLAVIIAGWFPVAPVRDAATLQDIPEVSLVRPVAYVDFAPFSDVLDAITLLSERQHIALLLGLAGLWGVWRFASVGARGRSGVALGRLGDVRAQAGSAPAGSGDTRDPAGGTPARSGSAIARWGGVTQQGWREHARSFAILAASIAVVYTAALCLPRPMARLASLDPDVMRIDFHSHTLGSKDARRSYSAERSRKWHHAGGYDVAYVTDHGTFSSADEGLANDPSMWNGSTILLRGIEANWNGEHVGVLGDERASRCLLSANLHDMQSRPAVSDPRGAASEPTDAAPDLRSVMLDSRDAAPKLRSATAEPRDSALDVRDAAPAGCGNGRAPIVVWNHPRDPQLKKLPLANGAVQAIEVANGALHSLDLIRSKRAQIVALAREHNLAMLSGTDRHGWGYAAPNWTLLRLNGWHHFDRDELAARIEDALRVRNFGATRVVERSTADPAASTTALAFSVVLVPWHMLRALSADERRMWLLWVWAIVAVEWHLRRRRVPRPEITVASAR